MKTSTSASSEIGTGGSKATDGTLWFTTVKGIVSINPRNIPINDLTPPVVIENLFADNLQFLPNDRILIPSSKDKIEFHYTALSFVDVRWIGAAREQRFEAGFVLTQHRPLKQADSFESDCVWIGTSLDPRADARRIVCCGCYRDLGGDRI